MKNNTHDHLAAAYSFLFQKKDSDVQPTYATLIEAVDTGWWYASFLPSGVLALNYYSDPDLMPKGLTSNLEDWNALISKTKHISHWIDDAEFIIDSPPEIASAATRCLSSATGIEDDAPWAAIGDAAASFDPLSAHGMMTALWAASRMPNLVSGFWGGIINRCGSMLILLLKAFSNSLNSGKTCMLLRRGLKIQYFGCAVVTSLNNLIRYLPSQP